MARIGVAILADRGFVDDALHYPNLNEHIIPQFMTGRKQFEVHEISADRDICELRYTCKVAFSRVTQMNGL